MLGLVFEMRKTSLKILFENGKGNYFAYNYFYLERHLQHKECLLKFLNSFRAYVILPTSNTLICFIIEKSDFFNLKS
jgi:hypothetical protein